VCGFLGACDAGSARAILASHSRADLAAAEFEEDGSPDLSTVKPMVDGGTEGFKVRSLVLAQAIARG
jgi:hypothetical protein